MHIHILGICGTFMGGLAALAREAGHKVTGCDAGVYPPMSDQLRALGIDLMEGFGVEQLDLKPDMFVVGNVVSRARLANGEAKFSLMEAILDAGAPYTSGPQWLAEHVLQGRHVLAVAGTHGKTTTTAMSVWLAKQLSMPIGYILPAKSTFAEMGAYEEGAEYFIYECDEFDRNFLHYHPALSIITGIDWDHPDIYPTREEYYQAFRDFLEQSDTYILWQSDADRLSSAPKETLSDVDAAIDQIHLAGHVNRRNAWQVAHAFARFTGKSVDELLPLLEKFPGVSRRFEQIIPGLYSDYAHTPEKIRGALQLGHEVAGDNLVVVYEGLHNTRQHFIREDLVHLFDSPKHTYIVPSYLAREDQSLELLTPEKLVEGLSETARAKSEATSLDKSLEDSIYSHLEHGDTVLCLTAGGGGSLDEWLRSVFQQ